MLIVNDRRVECLTPKSSAREDPDENLDASAHSADGRPTVPLQDKLFRMSGETGSYKYMARFKLIAASLCGPRYTHALFLMIYLQRLRCACFLCSC